jgi:hypothetical protein
MVMLGRIDLYLDRVKKGLRSGNHLSLFADVAEIGEISRRLYNRLVSERNPVKHESEETK